MRKDVQFVPLRELCDDWKKNVVSGPFGSNLKREHFVSSGIPVLKIQNVKPLELKIKNLNYVTSEKAHELRRHSFERGDLVVTKLGSPLGAAAIVEELEQGIIVADLVRIRASKVDTKYLCYHINSPVSNHALNDQQEGATRPRIKLDVLRDLPIYHPPLPEQKRIVSILDEAFGTIAKAKENAERNLANARELFDSYLNRVFTEKGDGWEYKKIPEVCVEFGRGKSRHRPRNESSLYGGPYPFIQTGDLSNANHIITEYKQSYSEKGLEQSKLWPKETVGIAIVGATIGETGVLSFEACFPDSIIAMSVDRQKANPYFIEFMLCHFIDLVKSQGEGSARENINLGTFDRLRFPIPSLSVQENLVTEFRLLAKKSQVLSTLYQQKLAALDELKQSLLQKAFTGQLTNKSAELELIG